MTLTEAAASELLERIRAGLLAEGQISEAMAVGRAYVSTGAAAADRTCAGGRCLAPAAPFGRCRA
ncbi:hypothetical protein [Paracoccus aminovorans]|uniref:hypothetical protein n=1 Tax=Paracoccus aminovorans TaxID=34004 RepID=UPI001FCE0FDF|nr:hypothetical protein [Paracoccus aminovorans]